MIVGSVYLLTDFDIPTIGSVIQVDLRLKEHKYRQVLSSNVASWLLYYKNRFCGSQLQRLAVVFFVHSIHNCCQGIGSWTSQRVMAFLITKSRSCCRPELLTESCLLDAESQYKQLVWNWAAASIQIEHPELDVSFLLPGNNASDLSNACLDDLWNGRCSLCHV